MWQSYSNDGGEHWPALVRSPFISSDSPADMVRLRNGKIVLLTNACQNWSNPRSYAIGGREVLHAAISADEGRSWHGFREILHETNVASRGDRGASYASGAENRDGKLVIASGQGEGNRAILIFDPRWLEEDGATNDLRLGPVEWTQYGSAGMRVEKLADGGLALAIASNASAPSGALWNFPMADAGEIVFRLQVPRGARDVRLSLNDHFNRMDDADAPAHAVYSIPLDAFLSGGNDGWHTVRLAWSRATDAAEITITVDEAAARHVAAQRRAQFGVNYLRVEFRSAPDDRPLLIMGLSSRRR